MRLRAGRLAIAKRSTGNSTQVAIAVRESDPRWAVHKQAAAWIAVWIGRRGQRRWVIRKLAPLVTAAHGAAATVVTTKLLMRSINSGVAAMEADGGI
jgi:hypothetical protein